MWITAATDPFGNRGELISRLYGMVGGTVDGHARLCAAAWLLDESELAVRLLRESLSRLRAPGVRGNCGATLSALQWACIDTGRWDEPLLACREATDLAAAYKMEAVAASASLATATVLAMRGVHDQVRPLVTSVLATIDAAEYRGFAARAWRAAGIAALAEGRYLTGYAQLSQLFGADGAPLHHRVSYLGIADLAAAAVRAERYLEARRMVERALARVDSAPGPRLDQLAARARGLVAEPADAESHVTKALSDPAGDAWPLKGSVAARLRGVAAADQRRQTRPRGGPGDVPPPRCRALDPARGGGTARLRRDRRGRAGGTRRSPASPRRTARSSFSPAAG